MLSPRSRDTRTTADAAIPTISGCSSDAPDCSRLRSGDYEINRGLSNLPKLRPRARASHTGSKEVRRDPNKVTIANNTFTGSLLQTKRARYVASWFPTRCAFKLQADRLCSSVGRVKTAGIYSDGRRYTARGDRRFRGQTSWSRSFSFYSSIFFRLILASFRVIGSLVCTV
jgi:hypothetical protein